MRVAPYVIEEYVRWSDVDFAGIIFYGSYVRFFEIAETELFRACGLAYAQVFDRYDIFLPRKVVHSEFFWPARLDDRLRVATYVGRVGSRSMTLNFDVLRDDTPALGAAGWMVLVCVDRRRLKPRPLPAGVVAALAPLTSGDWPVVQRTDSVTARGAIVGARFVIGEVAHGVPLDSGVVTVTPAATVISARARGSGLEIAAAGRVTVDAAFDAVPLGTDTVPCWMQP